MTEKSEIMTSRDNDKQSARIMTAEIIEGLTGEDTDLMDGPDLAIYFCDIQRLASLLVSPDLRWREREKEGGDDTCWCNEAKVTPISTNTIYRRATRGGGK